jgi:hypothetical protein
MLERTGSKTNDDLNQVDLAFVVDTTGSMGGFINAAREQMVAMLKAMTAEAGLPIDLHVGVVEYRDHPPQENSFVFQAHPFTADLPQVQQTINALTPSGGGDGPEAVVDGLRAAADELLWRLHAQRLAVLVGDAPPHGVGGQGDGFADGCPCGWTLPATTALLEEKGVILYALGLTPHVSKPFGELSQFTGGQYFAAAHGAEAIVALKQVLLSEFSDLDFDRRVRDWCITMPDWTIDSLCTALESPRGRVSASLSRLGRRGLLSKER